MRRLRNIPIRITIGGVFVLLLSAALLGTVLYRYYTSSDSILRVSDELIENNTVLAIDRTVSYLEPASVIADLSRALYDPEVGGLAAAPARFERYAVEVLRRYPQLAIFNIGDERGNIYGAERGDAGTTIVFETTRPAPDAPAATYAKTFVDRDGHVRKVEREPTTYDPRTRPWYRGAVQADGRYWTDVYVLVTDRRQVAISVAYPVKDAAGRVVGVVGGDLDIRELSTFLRQLRIGQHGFAFILDEQQRVVAYPEYDKAFVQQGDAVRLKRVDELDQPWLAEALAEHAATGARRVVVRHDGERQIVAIRPFPARFGKRWTLVVSVPEDDFVGVIKRSNRVSLLVSLGVLAIALVLASAVSSRISRPIHTLTDEANRIRELELDGDRQLTSAIKEINEIATAMYRMKTGMRAFKKYVPAALVTQLVRSGAEARLGGERRELTFLFSDIKGFTSVSETTPPEQLMVHLSSYLDELSRIIMGAHGTVDKYIGDAIMAFWGAPLPLEDHAFEACRAALACQRRLVELDRAWRERGLPAMPTRIGLHTGDAVVGNVGSSDRMNYTVLGDAVNLASRLEGVNKTYGTSILISQDTFDRVADRVLARPLDLVVVLGRSQPTRIYELLALADDPDAAARRDAVARYTDAFERFLEGRWDDAIGLLEPLAAAAPGDPVVARLLGRCRALRADPPSDDGWRCTQLDRK